MSSDARYGNALDAIGDTPMVELSAIQPDDGASIHVKWEGANPTGSLKDRMALAMIEKAREGGDLAPGDPVVEFTGGSTGSSLAYVCAVLAHPLHVVTADCVADEKIASMRALGAEMAILETPEGEPYDGLDDDLRAEAERIADVENAYFTDQFRNPDQLAGYEPLADEILAESPGITDFAMAVGTGGCAMGVARRFDERDADVDVTVVEPEASPVVTADRTGPHAVQGTAIVASPPLLDHDRYDHVQTLPVSEGVACVQELARHDGLLVGTSTGMNVAAAERIASQRDPDDAVVTIACDTGLKYLSDGLYEGLTGTEFCLA